MGSNWATGETILFSLIYVGGLLLLYGLGAYLMITAIKFMKEKNRNDREISKKIDELIQLTEKNNLPPKEE